MFHFKTVTLFPPSLTLSSLEDSLQIAGLRGVTDIISDLVAEGDVCLSELDFTNIQAKKISR